MNKPILYMLVGLPASGKSTWAERMVYDNRRWFSSDEIRKELDTKDNNKVFNTLHIRLFKELSIGHDVIYDATNVSRKYRIAFLKELEQKKIDCEKICILFLTPVYLCRKRNALRKGIVRVPDYVYDRMLRNFQLPMKEEGWDEVRIETIQSDMPYDTAAWIKEFGYSKDDIFIDKKWDMDQENEHHTLSLRKHQDKTFSYLFNEYNYMATNKDTFLSLLTAASYHDIGKFWTKVKKEGDHNAHYYGHENWGAYEFLVLIYMIRTGDGVGAKIANDEYISALLINWHMRPYQWDKNPPLEEKESQWLPPAFYLSLKLLHEADKEAH